MNIWVKRLIVFLIVAGIASLPVLMYFLHYKQAFSWNSNAIKTNCTIYNSTISKTQCACQCQSIVGRGCPICYQDCYNGMIDVWYNRFVNTFQVYTDYLNETELQHKLVKNYPIGLELACYYNINNPGDSRLELIGVDNLFSTIITFVVLSSFIITGWICYELYYWRRIKI